MISKEGRLFGIGQRILKEMKIEIAEFRCVKLDIPEGMAPI